MTPFSPQETAWKPAAHLTSTMVIKTLAAKQHRLVTGTSLVLGVSLDHPCSVVGEAKAQEGREPATWQVARGRGRT